MHPTSMLERAGAAPVPTLAVASPEMTRRNISSLIAYTLGTAASRVWV